MSRIWMLLAVIAMAIGWQRPAKAVEILDCDTTVIDDADVLGATQLQRVRAAADALNNQGADVRVRIVPDAAKFGNLDKFQAAMVRTCSSWQGTDGITKKNLIAMHVAMKGDYGIYAGSMYEQQLTESVVANIRTQKMLPWLQNEDSEMEDRVAGAIIAGLYAAGVVIKQPAQGAMAPPVTTSQMPERQTSPVVNAPSGPTDYTLLWVLLGLAVAVGAGFVFYKAHNGRAKKRAAQVTAQTAKSNCSRLVNESSRPLALAESRLSTVSQSVSAADIAPLQARLNALKTNVETAVRMYAQIGDPNRDVYDAEQLATLAGEYRSLAEKFNDYAALQSGLEADIEVLCKSVSTLPATIEQLNAEGTGAFDIAASAMLKAHDLGYKTPELDEQLEAAMEAADAAKKALAEKRISVAQSWANTAKKMADEIKATAENLPNVEKELWDRATAERLRENELKDKIGATTATLVRITTRYPESCWASVQGNDDDAKTYLAQAKGLLENAETSKNEHSDKAFRTARQQLDLAAEKIGLAQAEVDAVAELEALLTKAEQTAENEIRDAQTDLEALKKYEREYDADIDDEVKTIIAKADESLAKARALMTSGQKDVLEVVRLAKEVNATADRYLETSRNEHEAAERLRKKAVKSVESAETTITVALQYVQKHARDVGDDEERRLLDLRALLEDVRDANDLHSLVELAERTEKRANVILEEAKNRVRTAQRRRERASSNTYSPHQNGGPDVTGALVGLAGSLLSSSSGSSSGPSRPRSSGTGNSGTWGSRMSSPTQRSNGTGNSGKWK